MTFCWNQLCGRWVATVLTAVGALRVSIGPPIMVRRAPAAPDSCPALITAAAA